MKTSIFLILLLFSIPLFAQEENRNFDIRFGVGRTILGSGDMITLTFENELNYKINPYFTTALSLNYGRSNYGVFETASYVQGNLNLYLSPFKNTKRNDFRVGTGISLYQVSDAYLVSASYDSRGNLIEADYDFDERSSYGYSIILEDTYTIKTRFLIGLKLFTQPYFNGDINSGLLLKAGVKL